MESEYLSQILRKQKIVSEKENLTGRIREQAMSEKTEEMAAHMNRRIMYDWNESGGCKRRINVGEYKIAT